MGKTIILIHGRSFKPPKNSLKKIWFKALRFGIERDDPDKLMAFDRARKEFIYYGDISNEFLGSPDFDDTASRWETLEDLKKYGRNDFTKAKYKRLPGKSAWKETFADVSAGLFSAIRLSEHFVSCVAPDMREYWNPDTQYGSEVRYPMIAPLKHAMRRNDEILVISHSLGTMISYDTFWKFCRYGEYRPNYTEKKIHLWITLGSPLADETVKRYLKGARASGYWRYPSNIVRWVNVAAEDDYISHDGKVANDYAEMKKLGLIGSITDKRVYNLAVRDGKSNPHHGAGYLIHPYVAAVVAEWLWVSSD